MEEEEEVVVVEEEGTTGKKTCFYFLFKYLIGIFYDIVWILLTNNILYLDWIFHYEYKQ